jgi:hypothetical protein
MERKVFWIAVAFSSVLLAGCVLTRSIRYDSSPRAAKGADTDIPIYDSGDLPRPARVIGVVEANAGKLHDPSDTIEQLKVQARAMGGDALVDLSAVSSDGRLITKIGIGYVAGSVREKWTAKVVVWTD